MGAENSHYERVLLTRSQVEEIEHVLRQRGISSPDTNIAIKKALNLLVELHNNSTFFARSAPAVHTQSRGEVEQLKKELADLKAQQEEFVASASSELRRLKSIVEEHSRRLAGATSKSAPPHHAKPAARAPSSDDAKSPLASALGELDADRPVQAARVPSGEMQGPFASSFSDKNAQPSPSRIFKLAGSEAKNLLASALVELDEEKPAPSPSGEFKSPFQTPPPDGANDATMIIDRKDRAASGEMKSPLKFRFDKKD